MERSSDQKRPRAEFREDEPGEAADSGLSDLIICSDGMAALAELEGEEGRSWALPAREATVQTSPRNRKQ